MRTLENFKPSTPSRRASSKTREGAQHPDRDAQFHHISDMVARYQRQRQPVISVDTKKKELIGDFKNAGREWQPAGRPEPVRVHDFIDEELGKVAPYGVYDVTANQGGSAWASTTTRRSSRSRAFDVGGSRWVGRSIPRHGAC
jgi:hypothetical protein